MAIFGAEKLKLNNVEVTTDGSSLFLNGNTLNSGDVSVKTGNYTVTTSDSHLVGNSTSAITFTMIAASGDPGRELYFKNKNTGSLTIDAAGLGQIYSTSAMDTISLAQGEAVSLVSDGATWLVF